VRKISYFLILSFLILTVSVSDAQMNFWHALLTIQKQWPFGLDGNLTVGPGQTVYLSSKQIYDYNQIWIKAGGTLVINQTNPTQPIFLGARGGIIIDGTISMPQIYYEENNSLQYILTPDNKIISYSLPLARGGGGGNANCGISGGGGGGAPYSGGGAGAYGGPNGGTASSIYGGAGGQYGQACGAFDYYTAMHDGGAGGNAGPSGGILYLKTPQISGSGSINMYGGNGSGGSGAYARCGAGAAGGGGGGGGGPGGKLFYRVSSFASTITININAGYGAGGGPPTGQGCTNGYGGSWGGTGNNGPSSIMQAVL
jgi:hypothetical protein